MFRRRSFVLVIVCALAAAACSSDRGGGERPSAAVEERGPASGGSRFGDMASPCGEGDADGATDQGVADESISIGYGDDAGFPGAPGLGSQMSDAVKAFVRWCNDQGGINGRSIDATYYDAKVTEVNNAMTAACAREFMLVGQGWALDAGQEEVRRGCELPSIPAFAVSPQHANGPLKYETLPNPVEYVVISHGAHLAELFPDRIKKAGVLFGNFSSTLDSKDKVVPAFESLGYEFICDASYNIQGEADWRPLVQRLKNCGAEIVYWLGAPAPNFQNVLVAADQLDYAPVWIGDPNLYDLSFASWNEDGLGDQVYFRTAFVPLFEAEENQATKQYLEIVEADGGEPAYLGQQAAGAFLLWATAAQSCGSELTRECVLDALANTHEWTAGGLHAPADPGNNLPTQCSALLKLEGTGFVRVRPEAPGAFDCDPSYAYELESGPALERANLDENRVSQP